MAINLLCEMEDKEAWAFAKFLRRLVFEDISEKCTSEKEAFLVVNAVFEVEKALLKQGFNPR